MANVQTDNVKGKVPSPIAMGQESPVLRAKLTLTTGQIATTSVLEMVDIPPGYSVLDWSVDTDDLDSDGSPAIVFKVGILNSGKTDLDSGNNIWKTGATTAQAGGLLRADNQNAIRCGSSTSKRTVGIIPTTNPDAAQAGDIGITVWLKAD
jgi:hypothetical protein